MTTLTIYIDDELNNMIAETAKTIDRSKAYVVRKAVRGYLESNCSEQELNQLKN